jgi:hypothetical protein
MKCEVGTDHVFPNGREYLMVVCPLLFKKMPKTPITDNRIVI